MKIFSDIEMAAANFISFSLLGLIIFRTNFILLPFWQGLIIGAGAVLIIRSWALSSLSAIKMLKNKDLREWHAVEHKSIWLISKNLEPNVESLKTCPKTHLRCGTVAGINSLQFRTLIWLFFAAYTGILEYHAGLQVFYSLAILSSYLLPGAIHDLGAQKNVSPPIVYALAAPAAIFQLIVERIITLKEPSQTKMEEAVMCLKELPQFLSEFKPSAT